MKVNSYNDEVFPNKCHYYKDTPDEEGKEKSRTQSLKQANSNHFLIKTVNASILSREA